MSEANTSMTPDGDEADAAPEAAPPPPRNRKRLLFMVAAALLLFAAAGAATWFFLLRPPPDAIADAPPVPDTFVDVPPMQVMLRGADGRNRALRVHVMLVPGTLGAEEVTARVPQVLDRFQPFLRELRPEDMSGSAATFRIKEELLIRANQALGDGAVRDVLIQDLMQA